MNKEVRKIYPVGVILFSFKSILTHAPFFQLLSRINKGDARYSAPLIYAIVPLLL